MPISQRHMGRAPRRVLVIISLRKFLLASMFALVECTSCFCASSWKECLVLWYDRRVSGDTQQGEMVRGRAVGVPATSPRAEYSLGCCWISALSGRALGGELDGVQLVSGSRQHPRRRDGAGEDIAGEEGLHSRVPPLRFLRLTRKSWCLCEQFDVPKGSKERYATRLDTQAA